MRILSITGKRGETKYRYIRNVDGNLSTFRGTWPDPPQQISHVHAITRTLATYSCCGSFYGQVSGTFSE